jgi:2-hydroxychromene-2-carboxylate isomerase
MTTRPTTSQHPARLEMWFDFASPYSFVAMERLPALAREAGVPFALRPFLLGPIFQDQGWNDSPFRLFPAKGEYMMRDVARLTDKYGIAYRRPSAFPRMSVLSARLALLGQDQLWCVDFCQVAFRANFVHDRDIQSPDVMRDVLQGLALDADALLEQARGEAAKDALRKQVDRARELGIFGAPMCLVGGEMFWGNDRVDDAIAWAVTH